MLVKSCRYRGPIGESAEEYFVDVLRTGFSISAEAECNFLIGMLDEKVGELVLVNFTVCLLWYLDTSSASGRLNQQVL